MRQKIWFSFGWMLFLVILAVTVGIPLPLAVVGHEGSTRRPVASRVASG